MATKNKDLIMQNKVFGWLAVATAAVLTIPYMAMQFNWVKPDPDNPLDQGINWELGDFIVMGVLLFGAGTLFIAVARIAPRKYRLLIALTVITALFIT